MVTEKKIDEAMMDAGPVKVSRPVATKRVEEEKNEDFGEWDLLGGPQKAESKPKPATGGIMGGDAPMLGQGKKKKQKRRH